MTMRSENPTPSPRRLLVVDDNPSIHEDFRKIFSSSLPNECSRGLAGAAAALFGDQTLPRKKKLNYILDSAMQGQEGLEKIQAAVAQKNPYCVAFVDMRMPPGWDGLQTIEKLWEVDENLQVVICSAYSDHSWDEIIDKLGLTDKLLILKKPFDPVEVTQLAAALSEKWLLNQQANMKLDELERLVQERTGALEHAACTDKLTGLPNRSLVYDRLQQAVLRAKRLNDYHFAVLFLDFDRFKIVNDRLGHDVGDQLLQEISQRLRNAMRAGDTLGYQEQNHTAGRLGGDEFVVLLDGIKKPEDAQIVADRLLEAFAHPYHLGEHEVYSTASIGIVTSQDSSASAEDMLRDADTAMYEAKLAGKGQYVVFNVAMRQRMQNRLNLENDLRQAIDTNQLFLMYQPIVSLQSGKTESFEALVRWKHPQRGLISPGEFIPIAEESGLIIPIGEWVLREALRQFTVWREKMGADAPPSISVNLSRNQLLLPNLPQLIQQILTQYSMTPSSLHLEVTESAVMKDAETATRILRAIKNIGVKIDMDDFGTGYSSLACLHQFPIDVLKIDRSFVANIDRGRGFAALVQAVAQLARNLNITVVAEGIETTDQAFVLQSLECEFGQGYLFSKPIMGDAVLTFKVPMQVMPGQSDSEKVA